MAEIVKFDKFKIIKATADELRKATHYFSFGICDYCGGRPKEGYYIAVINKWYCAECFSNFKKRVRWFSEDAPIEERNFQYYGKLLGVIPDKDGNPPA